MQEPHSAAEVNNSSSSSSRQVQQKRQKFLRLSASLFALNQEQMCLQQELRQLKSHVRSNTQQYLRGQQQLSLLKAELAYRREFGSRRWEQKVAVASECSGDVQQQRDDLQHALREYSDCRRAAKLLQQQISARTDTSRRESLNFVAFCRYAHSVECAELRKPTTAAATTAAAAAVVGDIPVAATAEVVERCSRRQLLPQKREIAACRSKFSQQLQRSARELSEFYRMKIAEFRRQERILIGRTKDAVERTMGREAARRYAANSSNSNSSGGDVLSEAQQLLQAAAGITLHHNSSRRRASAVAAAAAMQSTAAVHANSMEHRFIQRLMEEPAAAVAGNSAATATADTADAPASAADTNSATLSAVAVDSHVLLPVLPLESQRLLLQHATKTAAATAATVHPPPPSGKTTGRRTASAGRSAAAAMAAVQQSGQGILAATAATAAVSNNRSSAMMMTSTTSSSQQQQQQQQQLMIATGPLRKLLCGSTAALQKRNPQLPEVAVGSRGNSSSSELNVKQQQQMQQQLQLQQLFDVAEFPAAAVSAQREAFPPHTLLQLQEQQHQEHFASHYNSNNNSSSSGGGEEAMAQVALQLAHAEGKYRQLNAVKEALDLHLVKQSHLLLLLSGDLHAECALPLPDSLRGAQAQKIDAEKLRAAFAAPQQQLPAPRHSALIGINNNNNSNNNNGSNNINHSSNSGGNNSSSSSSNSINCDYGSGSGKATAAAAVAAAFSAAATASSDAAAAAAVRNAALSLLQQAHECSGTSGAIGGRYRFRIEQHNNNHALIGRQLERDFQRAESNIRNVLSATAELLNIP